MAPGGVIPSLLLAGVPLFTSDPSDRWLSLASLAVVGLFAWRVLRMRVEVDGARMTIRNPWRTVRLEVTSATEFATAADGFAWARGVTSTGVIVRGAHGDTRVMATYYADKRATDAWTTLMASLRSRAGCADAYPEVWRWQTRSG